MKEDPYRSSSIPMSSSGTGENARKESKASVFGLTSLSLGVAALVIALVAPITEIGSIGLAWVCFTAILLGSFSAVISIWRKEKRKPLALIGLALNVALLLAGYTPARRSHENDFEAVTPTQSHAPCQKVTTQDAAPDHE